MKVEGLIPHMNQCHDYRAFQEVLNKHGNGSNLRSADNNIVTSDETCKMSTSVWKEIMNNFSQNDSDTLVSFSSYMESLKAIDKDFCYQILADSDGEITGCLWMTSTMRHNFELFGSYISVDAMKRDINYLLWPYMAVTMLNEMGNVCVGCEGIMLSEREEAYEAMLNFQINNTRRTKDEVHGLSADGILNQEVIERFGFSKTKYVSDYWHLFHAVSVTLFHGSFKSSSSFNKKFPSSIGIQKQVWYLRIRSH